MEQKKLRIILLAAAGVFALIAIALFVFGILYDHSVLGKVLLLAASLLVLLLSGEIGYLYILSKNDTKPNYFLYNPKTNRNIPVQKMTFAMVNTRLETYLAAYAPSEGKLWTERVFDNPYLDMGDEYKPLVAYKLLFELALRDTEIGWNCFEAASDETIEFIASALEMNNDRDMAAKLRELKSAKPINMKYVRDYIVHNRKYLQGKIFRYVYDNIRKF